MSRLPLPSPLLENLPAAPQAYVVGGTVRDLLMQRHPTDIDIAVDGDAALFAGAIADRLRGRVIPMGKPGLITHRVTGRGLLIDVTGLAEVTGTYVIYSPTEELEEGEHIITIEIRDVAGRSVSDASWLFYALNGAKQVTGDPI